MNDKKRLLPVPTADQHGYCLLLSLWAVLSVLSPRETAAQATGNNGAPRLVVSILVDQLRADYLDAFMPLYGENGFKKLLREGRIYSQADYPMACPDLASAAATFATGAAPSSHGIVGRRWIDRKTLRPIFCVDDATKSVTDRSSAIHLSVSTIGDELKIASQGKAMVYAVAPMREAAVLTAGHAADAAIWIDDNTGRWTTSSYYGGLPSFAGVRNSVSDIVNQPDKLQWTPTSDLVGNFSYFLSGGMKKPFSHRLKGDNRFALFKTSGLVNDEVAATVETLVGSTVMGSDAVPDHLAVTFYAGIYAGETEDAASMELQDTYVRLDKALERVITAVERKTGRNNTLFVLTSTGYATESQTDLSTYRIPTGTFDVQRASALLNMYLTAIYGQGNYIEASLGTQFYLNHKLINDKQISLSELLQRTEDFLVQLEGVKNVFTSKRLIQGAWTPGISKIRGGYNPQCSGDVMIEVSPGWHYTNSQTGERRYVRESYIPYPIIFWGADIEAQTIGTPVTVDCIAPTLSKAMRIRAPNACAAAPLF